MAGCISGDAGDMFYKLFETMQDCMALHEIICNDDGIPVDYRFLEINPAFEKITGLQRERVLGRTVLDVLPQTESYWIETYGAVALGGRSIRFENYSRELNKHFRVADVLNDERYISVSGEQENTLRSLMVAPVKTGERSLGTLSVQSLTPGVFTQDDERLLTTLGAQAAVAIEKAKLYADLEASLQHEKATRAQLVQSEKLAALGRIVASVAHELNNPLQAIQNALYLIKLEESLSPQAREDLQTILDEADRMTDLIDRLRETYRPTASEEFYPDSLNVLLVEVQKLISTHLRHNQIEVRFLPDKDLPKVPMIRDQIKQVILNISLNAVEAMPEGGIMTIQTKAYPKNGGVSFSISDTGPSINPKILPYIFDPFVTTKEGGTGLGLAISYDIVHRHDGHIEVKSEPDRGTTFLVWLPGR